MGFPIADTGAVTEDSGVVGGLLSTSGDIDFWFGNDTGQWTAETISGAYGGGLVIDADGKWTYTAENADPTIAALNDGQTVSEVFSVTSTGGTSTITITINGHTDPPCFVAGTLIDTPDGPRPIESLVRGDLVLRHGGGVMPIRWIGGARIGLHNAETADKFQPVRIRANALGRGVPSHDLLLSPLHRVVVNDPDVPLLFGESEVLCTARHLVNDFTILRETCSEVTYYHMLFDCHEVVISNGCASESFYPGHVGLDGLEMAQQDELFSIFPDLRSLPESYGPMARMALRGYEARLLRDRLLPKLAQSPEEPETLWAKRAGWIR